MFTPRNIMIFGLPFGLAAHAYNEVAAEHIWAVRLYRSVRAAGVKVPNKITVNQTFQNLGFLYPLNLARRRECLLLPRFYGKTQFIPRRAGIFPAADHGWANTTYGTGAGDVRSSYCWNLWASLTGINIRLYQKTTALSRV